MHEDGFLGKMVKATLEQGPRAKSFRFQPKCPLLVLDEETFAVIATVTTRTVQGPGADPVTLAHAADVALSRLSKEAQEAANNAMRMLERSLVMTQGAAAIPFTEAKPEVQDTVLLSWIHSEWELLRGLGNSMRKLGLGAYYANLEVGRGIGYPGPPIDKPDPGPIVADAPLSPPFVPVRRPAR
ncbi:MAG: hypothetical protein U1E65_18900 [Myxococcota bacterium]